MLLTEYCFGFNTNLFETNVLNLRVVLAVVTTVVGDALRTLLDTRLQGILSALQEANRKAKDARDRLDEARRAVGVARTRAQKIREQAIQDAEQEKVYSQQLIEEDLRRLRDRGELTIKIERQKAVNSITQQVVEIALATAETKLLEILRLRDTASLRQKKLNEVYVREVSRQLSSMSL
jgi:F-type H+-transporting ATPase subunit b